MTNPYRAMCAELLLFSEEAGEICMNESLWPKSDPTCTLQQRARALLDQPVAEEPTDEEIMELMPQQMRDDLAAAARALAGSGRFRPAAGAIRIILNRHAVGHARAALAKWGHLTPQPVWADIHYAWELEDAEGEWQAGGSANRLEDVQREGNRYLQTYEQDGPHKLIIQRHCVNTIEEVTNG